MTYADTSFLASIYMPDANTPVAMQFLTGFREAFPFTALHRIELHNAMALAVFRNRLSVSDMKTLWRDVEVDIAAGRLVQLSLLWEEVFRDAHDVAVAHSPIIGSRSLDVLHLAVARALQTHQLLTFDGRQQSLAVELGLRVAAIPTP